MVLFYPNLLVFLLMLKIKKLILAKKYMGIFEILELAWVGEIYPKPPLIKPLSIRQGFSFVGCSPRLHLLLRFASSAIRQFLPTNLYSNKFKDNMSLL